MSRPQEIAQRFDLAPRRSPLVAPPLAAITARGMESHDLQRMLLSHSYQPPRGKAGAPLMALPIWFPVAARPEETLTLPQVVYRTLGSVREPFRRSRIVLGDAALARSTYTELLDWSVRWADTNLGASLIPVPLSLRRLASGSARLEMLTQKLAGEKTGKALSTTLLDACRELLELGMAPPTADTTELVSALAAGNAWLLLEDDLDDEKSIKSVRRAFDAVFGPAGLSDAGILLVTARDACNVLSDVQTYSEGPLPEYTQPPRHAAPNALTARLCQVLSRLGTPGGKPTLLVLVILGLGLISFGVPLYEEYLRIAAEKISPSSILGGIFVFSMVAGGFWGVFYGTEEVRRSFLDLTFFSILAVGGLWLFRLPRDMAPGLLKTISILLASVPAAAFLALTALGIISLIANVFWLLTSVRICRRLDAAGLMRLAEAYRLVLHIAHFSAELPIPHGPAARIRFPLLVCFRNSDVLPALLERHASLALDIEKLILAGISNKPEPYSMSAASLALKAVSEGKGKACRRCAELVGHDCLASWSKRMEFQDYQEPSTTFTMNALEYVARRLCYLTNLEELIVVR